MSGPVSTSRKIQPMHDPPVKKTKTVVSLPAPYPQSLDSPWDSGISLRISSIFISSATAFLRFDSLEYCHPSKKKSVPCPTSLPYRFVTHLARLHLLGPIFAIFAGLFAGKP